MATSEDNLDEIIMFMGRCIGYLVFGIALHKRGGTALQGAIEYFTLFKIYMLSVQYRYDDNATFVLYSY